MQSFIAGETKTSNEICGMLLLTMGYKSGNSAKIEV